MGEDCGNQLFPCAGIILIRSKGYDLSRFAGTPKVWHKGSSISSISGKVFVQYGRNVIRFANSHISGKRPRSYYLWSSNKYYYGNQNSSTDSAPSATAYGG